MFRSYVVLVASFCLLFAFGCGDDESTTGGSGGDGGTGGTGAVGGAGGTGGAEESQLGCSAVGNDFGLTFLLDVVPAGDLTAGSQFDADFTGVAVLSEEFIQAAEDVLGFDFVLFFINQAVVDMFGPSQLTYTAVSGATGSDVTVVLAPLPFEIDLEEDADNNGIPGPFEIPFPTVTGTFTAGASGEEACFNFTGQATDPQMPSDTMFTGIAVDSTGVIMLPATFRCEPADPAGLGVDCEVDADCLGAGGPGTGNCELDVSCEVDADCTINDVQTGTCAAATADCDTDFCCDTAGTCEVVIVSDPTAGQVCLPIP